MSTSPTSAHRSTQHPPFTPSSPFPIPHVLLVCCLFLLTLLTYILYLFIKSAPLILAYPSRSNHNTRKRTDADGGEEARDPYEESRGWDPSPSLTPLSRFAADGGKGESPVRGGDRGEGEEGEEDDDGLRLRRYFKEDGVGIERYRLDGSEGDGSDDGSGETDGGGESLKDRVEDWVDRWVDRGVEWGMTVLGERGGGGREARLRLA